MRPPLQSRPGWLSGAAPERSATSGGERRGAPSCRRTSGPRRTGPGTEDRRAGGLHAGYHGPGRRQRAGKVQDADLTDVRRLAEAAGPGIQGDGEPRVADRNPRGLGVQPADPASESSARGRQRTDPDPDRRSLSIASLNSLLTRLISTVAADRTSKPERQPEDSLRDPETQAADSQAPPSGPLWYGCRGTATDVTRREKRHGRRARRLAEGQDRSHARTGVRRSAEKSSRWPGRAWTASASTPLTSSPSRSGRS